jgi:hypothetical protein
MNLLGLKSDVGVLRIYVVKVTAWLGDLPVETAIVAGPYTDELEARAAGDELAKRNPGEHYRVIGSVEELHVEARL